jgi:hypothetical protein
MVVAVAVAVAAVVAVEAFSHLIKGKLAIN